MKIYSRSEPLKSEVFDGVSLTEPVSSDNELSLKKALEELHLHQTELEMQNDELRIANEKLEVQQLKFSGMYDLAPIGYYILGKNGQINEVNDAGIELLGTGRDNIINNRLQAFISQDHADAYHFFFRDMISSGNKKSAHFKMISKKGREFFVQMEGIVIAPNRTLPLQIDIAVMDITKQVLAEKALAQTKERLELALEASLSGTWELELDTMKFYLDESNYQTCAIPGGKFDGRYQTFINLIHPDDRAGVDRQFRLALNSKDPIDIVCRFENQNGQSCFASIRGHIIIEAGQHNRFVGIMMDITAKKKLEEVTLRMQQDQQRNIALATIRAEENERRRISDALHDSVSQLLYGIRIKLGTLLDTDDPADVMRDVYSLLDMAVMETRNISFELAPSILNDFGLKSTIEEMAKRLSTPKMIIKTKLTRLTGRLNLAMESSIFRILQELVNNAMKHSEASLITVEVRKSKLVELFVSDNGKGFAAASQGDTASGSGLTSIKNRVSLYNGSLAIESAPGKGTTVKIKLDVNPQ